MKVVLDTMKEALSKVEVNEITIKVKGEGFKIEILKNKGIDNSTEAVKSDPNTAVQANNEKPVFQGFDKKTITVGNE